VIEVRRAVPGDAEELLRLRQVMLAVVGGHDPESGPWQGQVVEFLRERLPDPRGSVAVYVVDAPGEAGKLASCAVGLVQERLGSPWNSGGLVGLMLNVATDPRYRHQGYARACVSALLDWFERSGVGSVELTATDDGLPLYRSLGFVPSRWTAMRLRWPTAPGRGRGRRTGMGLPGR